MIELIEKFKYQELILLGNKYLIGVCKKDNLRQIILTNFIDFYEEKFSNEDVIKKCKELNPLLITDSVVEIVDELLFNIPKYIISSTIDCKSIDILQLETKIEDGYFYFNLNLKKNDVKRFNDIFMENLCISFSELYHRYNCLLDIVKKKDQEIIDNAQEYSISEPFTEKLFDAKLKNSKTEDKIKIFLNIIDFYNSIKIKQLPDVTIKQELTVNPNETQSESQSVSNEKSTKRLSSSDIRCAITPKFEKKAKVCKRGSEFKFL